MMQVEGYVQKIETKPTSTGKTMYNVSVNGKRYGAGLYPPKFKEGDFISFTATKNGNFDNMETRTVTQKTPPAGMVPQPAAPSVQSSVGGGNWDTRQDIISKQAALNSAQHMVEILVTAGAVVGLDKAKTPADKMSLLNALVDEYTADYYFQNTGRELDLKPREIDSIPAGEDKPAAWE